MKLVILLFFALWHSLALLGQDIDVRKDINKIKKSNQYLSAEATLDTEEAALKTANELLVNEINDWVKQKRHSEDVKQIVLQDISSSSEYLNMKRGAKVRVFVYVKKSDIVLIKGAGQIVLSEDEKGNDLQALSDVAGDMNLEKSEDKGVAEPKDVRAEALSMVTEAKNMVNMKNVFTRLKSEQHIEYGKYPASDLPESYYILFYMRTGDIKGVVEVSNEKYRDLSTNQEVQLSQFSGCGAYWFILK